MSDEITVDPEALANERQRLTALSSSISATITAIDTAAADVLTETAEWGTKWEALGAYDPTAASLNEGMVKIAASLGAIKSELDNQAQVTVTRAEDTEAGSRSRTPLRRHRHRPGHNRTFHTAARRFGF
ncbi:hypothetical protein [Mycolicibacterium mageritense]|uniref:WXG100 family type VII secretion target n=1 Tax=Mycolicibacterium mageritense TaxID=53462 RepID=A0ABM7HJS7_MYCME|nr:hypothetical protein [Mycolicibacterium mageritense]BBX30725.1 hypothetical protein MMAGJ_00070 [Mycolicibacterium mageritense]